MPTFPHRKRSFRRRPRAKKSLRKVIKAVITSQAEKKFHNLIISNSDLVNATPFTNSLSQVPQGNLVSQRIGDNIDTVRLRLRYNIKSVGTGQTPESVRVMVFQQLSNGTVIGIPEDIQNLWPTLNVSIDAYKVLFDRTYDMGLGVHSDFTGDITIRNMQKQLTFSTGDTNIMGEIFLRVITDNDTMGNLQFLAESRLYYTDQ